MSLFYFKEVEKETFNQEVEFLKAKESILISSIDDLKQNVTFSRMIRSLKN